MPRDTKPDDQSKLPTKPLAPAGAVVPSDEERLMDSLVGAALGAGCSKPSPGEWVPPTPEELQRDFPQYEIRGILGRGGMGAVYKGWQTRLDRFVAIKILPPGLDDSISDFTERFKREAKAMAHLQHPGIVAVYDAGKTFGGLLYFVMECIEGTDVHRLLNERKRLDPGDALRIISAVCDALAYAHARGVIHRDIKPSNIMLDEHNTVKVADFGLAKSTAPETTALTAGDVTMGTPDFMAPEAHHGAAHVDHRADIYAVGVMLYQTLTGTLPRGKYDRPSRAVPGLDRRLDRIVDRALQPKPEDRYSSAAELRADIEPVRRSIIKRAAARNGRTASRKTPARIALAALALAVVVLLAKCGPWKTGGANGKPRTLVSPTPPAIALGPPSVKTTTPATASKTSPFVNTLGQEFVPVPGPPALLLFCRWETRVKDYRAFADAKKVDPGWTKLEKEGVPVAREPDHPVAGVSWDDANAFCEWLTTQEIADGKLPRGMQYRLPTDQEWSRAVGLEKEDGATPKARNQKNTQDFPWGRQPAPPNGKAGNYADSAFHEAFPKEQDKWIVDYTDGFATTAPAGSFEENKYGIYDLGGNVWEWCHDLFEPGDARRVTRGASWGHSEPDGLLSSYRRPLKQDARIPNYGFRCVLVPVSSAPPSAVAHVVSIFASTTKDHPFMNTLGQEFVPVPGTMALFCRWDTRVRDFAEYAQGNPVEGAWMKQEKDGVPVSRELEYPAVGVSWNDAIAFCVWLTEKENTEGRLPKGLRYRLPTDEEWSRAVGLAQEEGDTPKERSGRNAQDFPWGSDFPPLKGPVGNYADSAWQGRFPKETNWMKGYTDDYATTSPVGSFAPNQYGLYDMGGNVWQWCDDLFDSGSTEYVLRGASWNDHDRSALLSSSRNHGPAHHYGLNSGFRCVIGVSGR